MPKLCLICGKRDDDGCWDTCPACGEGSWMQLEPEKKAEPQPEPKPRKGKR